VETTLVTVNATNRELYRITGKCKKSGFVLNFSFIVLGKCFVRVLFVITLGWENTHFVKDDRLLGYRACALV
jgi:hypothetical protein